MSDTLRIWTGTVVAGLIVAGVGIYDAFANASHLLTAAGDATFIIGGAGVIVGHSIFQAGVNVTPVDTTPPSAMG